MQGRLQQDLLHNKAASQHQPAASTGSSLPNPSPWKGQDAEGTNHASKALSWLTMHGYKVFSENMWNLTVAGLQLTFISLLFPFFSTSIFTLSLPSTCTANSHLNHPPAGLKTDYRRRNKVFEMELPLQITLPLDCLLIFRLITFKHSALSHLQPLTTIQQELIRI